MNSKFAKEFKKALQMQEKIITSIALLMLLFTILASIVTLTKKVKRGK